MLCEGWVSLLKINLLPEKLVDEKKLSSSWATPLKLVFGAALLFFVVTATLHLTVARAQARADALTGPLQQICNLEEREVERVREKRNLERKLENLETAESSILWWKFFSELKTFLPPDLWVASIEATGSKGSVFIRGRSSSYDAVNQFLNSLQKSTFVTTTAVRTVSKSEAELTSEYQFDIVCGLKVTSNVGDSQ